MLRIHFINYVIQVIYVRNRQNFIADVMSKATLYE